MPRRTVRLLLAASLAVPAAALPVVGAGPAQALVACARTTQWAVGEPGRGADVGAVHLVALSGSTFSDVRLAQGAAVAGGVAVPGTGETGDRFGEATAIGDFDHDGCRDVAIGAPGEDGGRGAVTILFGAAGLPNPYRVITEAQFTGGVARPGEHFGGTLATGDLDGDLKDELVVGAPDERVSATGSQQGGVAVVTGAQLAAGTATFPQRIITADSTGAPGTPENGDRFGRAVALGDFEHDGDVDLAVGVPGENASAGAVVVFTNPGTGLASPFSARLFDQDSPGVPGTSEAGDLFGAALAAGEAGLPGIGRDLAVGAPGENSSAGAVTFLDGTPGGLTGTGSVVRTQDSPGVDGVARAGDRFGAAVVMNELGDTQTWTVVIGVPGDVVSGHAGAGAVNLLAGTASGPQQDPGDVRVGLLSQDSTGMGGTAEAGDRFGASLSTGAADQWVLIGVPGEDLGGVANAGGINLLRGGTFQSPYPVFAEAGTTGIVGVRDPDGRLGAATAD